MALRWYCGLILAFTLPIYAQTAAGQLRLYQLLAEPDEYRRGDLPVWLCQQCNNSGSQSCFAGCCVVHGCSAQAAVGGGRILLLPRQHQRRIGRALQGAAAENWFCTEQLNFVGFSFLAELKWPM